MTGKGIDAVTTELCVTAPMDAGGYARPRVLLGAFLPYHALGIRALTCTARRCDERAAAAGHHGVQGALCMLQLRVC